MPRLRNVVPLLFVAVATFATTYGFFARWAVNAPAFGKHDMGWALFFAFSATYAFLTGFWLVPVALLTATVVVLTKWGSPWLYLVTAGIAALPTLVLG